MSVIVALEENESLPTTQLEGKSYSALNCAEQLSQDENGPALAMAKAHDAAFTTGAAQAEEYCARRGATAAERLENGDRADADAASATTRTTDKRMVEISGENGGCRALESDVQIGSKITSLTLAALCFIMMSKACGAEK